MAYVVASSSFRGGERFGDVYVKGEYWANGGDLYVWKGGAIEYSNEDVLDRNCQESRAKIINQHCLIVTKS